MYTADTDTWSYKTFPDKEAFIAFVKDLFKEPGQYGFDETMHKFNEQARKWLRDEYYCGAPFRSTDYIKYWDLKKRNVEEVVFLSTVTRFGTYHVSTTCGSTSYGYMIRLPRSFVFQVYGTCSITWPFMNYWQSCTVSMP